MSFSTVKTSLKSVLVDNEFSEFLAKLAQEITCIFRHDLQFMKVYLLNKFEEVLSSRSEVNPSLPLVNQTFVIQVMK